MIDNFLMEIPKGHSAELEEVNESRIIHTAVPAVPFVGTEAVVSDKKEPAPAVPAAPDMGGMY